MKVLRILLVATLAIGVTATVASAGSFTFVTAPNATEAGGRPVDASTTITTGNGTVTVSLSNLLANPIDVSQTITDLFFTLNLTGLTTLNTSLTGSSGQEITVNNNGTFTLGPTGSTGWNLDLTTGAGGTIHLCTIGSSPCGGGIAPAHGLIGPPNGSNVYFNANGSIAGNGPHNPFLNQTITFSLNVGGVTTNTTVTSAIFSFGTTAGDNVPGVPGTPTPRELPNVPEPASLALLGSGLAFLSTRLRRQ